MNKLNGISIQHNLTEENLKFCIKNFDGKMISPCLAVVKNENLLDSFGEIMLLNYQNDDVMKKSKIFSSDIYSPRMDFLYYKLDTKELQKYCNEKYQETIYCEKKYYNEYSFDKDFGFSIKKIIKKTHPKYEESNKLLEQIHKIEKNLDIPAPKGYLSKEKEEKFENLKIELSELRRNYKSSNDNDNDKYNKIMFVKEEITKLNNERIIEPTLLKKFNNKKELLEKTCKNMKTKYRTIVNEINTFVNDEFNFLLFNFKEDGLFMINGENNVSGKKHYRKVNNQIILRRLKKDLVNGENHKRGEFIYLRNTLADSFTYSQYSQKRNQLASNEEESLNSKKVFESYILENYKDILKDFDSEDTKLFNFYDLFENGKINISSTLRRKFNETFKSRYFEAKPQREVEFNEFEIALVPENCKEETIKFLSKNNLKIFKYKYGQDVNIMYQNILKNLKLENKLIKENGLSI